MHAPLKAQILEDIALLIDCNAFANGPDVRAFEHEFADYCGMPFCVGVANGLDALRLGLQAHGVGPGDDVLLPANTFIASFEAVSQVGANPVPVDVAESDYNIDVEA